MSTHYRRYTPDLANAIGERRPELAAMLRAGESVTVGTHNVLTPDRVSEHAYCNDLSHDEACEQLAAHYVEAWANYEWVNA